MKVTVVSSLGAMVAYKPTEVQVIESIWNKVPESKRDEFETILIKAKESYDFGVAEAKKNGEKPQSAYLKKESIINIIEPYLIKIGVSQEKEKIIRPKNPGIPGNEKPRVSRQKYELPEIEIDKDEVSDIFDTFNSDSLSDDLNVQSKPVDDGQTYSEDLLMGGDVFSEVDEPIFENDEFDFEHLLD